MIKENPVRRQHNSKVDLPSFPYSIRDRSVPGGKISISRTQKPGHKSLCPVFPVYHFMHGFRFELYMSLTNKASRTVRSSILTGCRICPIRLNVSVREPSRGTFPRHSSLVQRVHQIIKLLLLRYPFLLCFVHRHGLLCGVGYLTVKRKHRNAFRDALIAELWIQAYT